MKTRLLLLSVLVSFALLVAAGAAMSTTAHPMKSPTPPSAVCASDLQNDTIGFSSLEPVTSCAGGCPAHVEDCINGGAGAPCHCPAGDGICVPCGPNNQSWKCQR
jgi:hypothetical protein